MGGVWREAAGVALAVLLGGCALNPPRSPADDPAAVRCLDLYGELDAAVAEHGASPVFPTGPAIRAG